ncbi:MAG: AAA family ATPase [Bacteroidota bacterium]
MKIHIFGASGSGTTTLGKALYEKLGYRHLDADDYYWERTDPPFQQKVPLSLRNQRITQDFLAQPDCIISGSMVSWGKEWASAFDLYVFLYVPPAIRLQRLKDRELTRYGDALFSDSTLQQNSAAFLDWASQYDDSTFQGRSLTIHLEWISRLDGRVLRIEGDRTVGERVGLVLGELENITPQY